GSTSYSLSGRGSGRGPFFPPLPSSGEGRGEGTPCQRQPLPYSGGAQIPGCARRGEPSARDAPLRYRYRRRRRESAISPNIASSAEPAAGTSPEMLHPPPPPPLPAEPVLPPLPPVPVLPPAPQGPASGASQARVNVQYGAMQ